MHHVNMTLRLRLSNVLQSISTFYPSLPDAPSHSVRALSKIIQLYLNISKIIPVSWVKEACSVRLLHYAPLCSRSVPYMKYNSCFILLQLLHSASFLTCRVSSPLPQGSARTAIWSIRHDEAFTRARWGNLLWYPQPLSRGAQKSSSYSVGGSETQSVQW